jgi:hypothetical protein
MGDNVALQKRLEFYRAALGSYVPGKPRFKSTVDSSYLTNVLKVDPLSLEKSAQFFGLDHTHPPDLSVLTHVLAEIVIGTRRRGKRKGYYKIWTEERFLELASKYHELKAQNPTCLDNELADLISHTGAFWEYRDNSEPIRQRLPKAKTIPHEA